MHAMLKEVAEHQLVWEAACMRLNRRRLCKIQKPNTDDVIILFFAQAQKKKTLHAMHNRLGTA